MSDCVFCKIVDGTIPSHRIYEDEQTLGIMDIGSVNPGHALVLVKPHHATMLDLPEDLAAAAFRTANRLAKRIQTVLRPDGMTLLQANGEAGWQTMPHFHIHLLPRTKGDTPALSWPVRNPSQEELAEMAARLRIP